MNRESLGENKDFTLLDMNSVNLKILGIKV